MGFCELGTQQEDLGRVKDPYQDDDERSRGAVGGRHIIASNVKADQMLADGGVRPWNSQCSTEHVGSKGFSPLRQAG